MTECLTEHSEQIIIAGTITCNDGWIHVFRCYVFQSK